MLKVFSASLLLSASLLVTSCAFTATGTSKSRFNKVTIPQTLSVTAPKGSAFAVIRYPASIDSSAESAFHMAFTSQAIGGGAPRASSPELSALADSVIVKSNYFALSLFKELAAKLPEHSVLLSPHRIELDGAGRLTSVPMTKAENISNVLTIDFASYTFPDTKKMMGGEPLTFGDIITPIVTIRADHQASAATHGLIMSTRCLLYTSPSPRDQRGSRMPSSA